MNDTFILGAGVTGLAAGLASGLPVYEAVDTPGGICSSYYMLPGNAKRLRNPEKNAYRFEIGGGHWIFGGDPLIKNFINQLTPMQTYQRRSSVYFPQTQQYVPYPLQNHLQHLKVETAAQALVEMLRNPGKITTMQDWLQAHFGPTLCQFFFFPFHQLYTAELYTQIAPQDAYKSPVQLSQAIRGAMGQQSEAGYNIQFAYPIEGLDTLARRMADRCQIDYGKRVTHIDVIKREIYFADQQGLKYTNLLSTLPLNHMLRICDLKVPDRTAPCTSVLVLNIGAKRGKACPNDHWLYIPQSASGFHRVGFYSHVDIRFVPASASEQRVSIYVEKAYLPDKKPSESEIQKYAKSVIRELQDWEYITEVEVLDPTWIEVAYTWDWPHSNWRQQALDLLQQHGIFQIGRYGRWVFQGIADSIRDGLFAGATF